MSAIPRSKHIKLPKIDIIGKYYNKYTNAGVYEEYLNKN